MSFHQDRTVVILERAVQTVLSRGLHDPRVRGLISVTKVEISPDKRRATVGLSVIPVEHEELAVHGIKHAATHIRSEVAKLVRMRRVPELEFKVDATLKKEADVLAAIRRGRERDEELKIEGEAENRDREE